MSKKPNMLSGETDGASENSFTKEATFAKPLGENQIAYSRGEEWTNRITHLVGAGLAVIGSALLIVKTVLAQMGALPIVAVCLYAFAMIELYTMSTLYHFQPVEKTRRAVFRRFDHCSVALLIAGTYAPLMLIGLGGWMGITVASVNLGIAVLVIVLNAVNVQKFRKVCMVAYIVMGWLCILVVYWLVKAIGWPCFLFTLGGGLAYSVGIVFYRIKKIKFNHAIWHFFVLAGTIIQFFGIYYFLIP